MTPGEATVATHIEHLDAGSVSLVGSDGEIRLLWATPQLGWQVDVEFVEAGHLLVSFTDDEQLWTVTARIVDGAIEVVTEQVVAGPR